MIDFNHVARTDPQIYELILKEYNRQLREIELIASENVPSEAVLEAQASYHSLKYAEGYPGRRYYGGCKYIDETEQLAIDRACKLFNCKFANVQPHSGAQANEAVYNALLKPGDKVLSMSLNSGGHISHMSTASTQTRYYEVRQYDVNPDTFLLDYEQIAAIAREFKPNLIIAGASAYPREINFLAFREIADEVGAYLMVDMAHIAGLVAAGLHQSPFPYADVVTSTTHKTLRRSKAEV